MAPRRLADDGMALFSSRGSFSRGPDVVAPGAAVLSTRVPGSFLDEAFPAARIGDGFRGSGTSQAAVLVSRAAALGGLWEARPRSPTRSSRCCARPPARWANTEPSLQGAGVIDVRAATRSLPARGRARQRFLEGSHRAAGWRGVRHEPVRGRDPSSQPLGRQPLGQQSLGQQSLGQPIAGAANRWGSQPLVAPTAGRANRWSSNRWVEQPAGRVSMRDGGS